MTHSSPQSTEPGLRTKAPVKRSQDDPGHLTDRAYVVIGFAGTVFGCLFAVGFTFLPVSTLPEKAFVSLACLALSVATITGIGAWRSGRRFSITASLVALALICLAALSVTASGRVVIRIQPSSTTPPNTPQMSLSPSPISPSSASSTSPSSTATDHPSGSTSPGPAVGRSLIDMPAVDASSTPYQSGRQKVDGRIDQRTLYDSTSEINCNDSVDGSITYQLDYRYHHFHATVGVADTTLSGDTITFSILADGQPEGMAPTLGVGKTETIDLDVSGIFRITLQDACSTPNSYGSGNITAVWVNPAVS
jgi:hypothetical protein